MKKILALVLALCLLCNGVALADNTTINQDSTSKDANTTVNYTIAANETYTVTIPSSVALSNSGDKLSGAVSVRLETPNFNVVGKTIAVRLTSAGYKLVNGDKEIPYSIKAAGVDYKTGDTVLKWTYGDTKTDNTVSLVIQSTSGFSGYPAGNYTDTLTFNVSVTATTAGVDDVTIKD